MKMRIRLSAMLLTLCLIVSMMVPAVSATNDPVATKTVEYSFSSYADVLNLTAQNTSIGAAGVIDGLNNAYGVSMNSNYFTRGYGSISTKNPTLYISLTAANGTFKCMNYQSKVGDWVAYKFKAPGTGSFTISVLPYGESTGAKECGVYVFSAKDVAAGDIASKINSETPITSKLNLCNIKTTQEVGTYDFGSSPDEDYIIVFKAITDCGRADKVNYAQINLTSITMTRTTGEDTATEMANAPIGSTVKVDGNLQLSSALTTKAAITVSEGAALDLNGNNLTAASVACMGTGIVKDSQDGTGKLSVTTGGCSAVKTDSQLPLTDNGAYRFFNTTVQSLGTTGTDNNKFWFRVSFTNNAAYALAATQMDIGAGLTADEITAVTEAWAGTDFTANWKSAVENSQPSDICFTAKNFGGLTNFKLTPMVKANGVTVSGNAL